MLRSIYKNPFLLLGATVRDNRKKILDLAEEKSLKLDHDTYAKARSDLTNSRIRLSAEISWLPGISPRRGLEYLTILKSSPVELLNTIWNKLGEGDIGISIAVTNLMFAAFSRLDPTVDSDDISHWIANICYSVDGLDENEILRSINEDRLVSGFPEVKLTDIESELFLHRHYYLEVINIFLNSLSSTKLVDVLTKTLEETTNKGEYHAPLLVDELIDSYQQKTNNFLQKEAENIKKLVVAVREAAVSGEINAEPLIERLDEVVRKWDRVAQPIQLSMKARGLEHDISHEIAIDIRSLGIDLFNEHNFLDASKQITKMLQDVFAELPEVAQKLDEDEKTLDNIFNERIESQKQNIDWRREITYETKLGLIFKDKLRISPEGAEWKGQFFPLDKIDRVRWGAVRKSVNGIPTGTDYTIAFGDSRSEAIIQTNKDEVYSSFTNKLWRAVCVRMLTEYLVQLRDGKKLIFDKTKIDDDGIYLIKHKFWGSNEQVYCSWNNVSYRSVDGSLLILLTNDDNTYVNLSFMNSPNTHILEAMIRLSFEKWKGKLSGLLGN